MELQKYISFLSIIYSIHIVLPLFLDNNITLIAIWCAYLCRMAVELRIYGAQLSWYIYKHNLITYNHKQKDELFKQNWNNTCNVFILLRNQKRACNSTSIYIYEMTEIIQKDEVYDNLRPCFWWECWS